MTSSRSSLFTLVSVYGTRSRYVWRRLIVERVQCPSPCSCEVSRCWNNPSHRITSSPFLTLTPSLQEAIHGGLHCLRIGSCFISLYLHLEPGLSANHLR